MSFWSTISKILPLYLAESSFWLAMYQSRFFLRGSGTPPVAASWLIDFMTTETAYHNAIADTQSSPLFAVLKCFGPLAFHDIRFVNGFPVVAVLDRLLSSDTATSVSS